MSIFDKVMSYSVQACLVVWAVAALLSGGHEYEGETEPIFLIAIAVICFCLAYIIGQIRGIREKKDKE